MAMLIRKYLQPTSCTLGPEILILSFMLSMICILQTIWLFAQGRDFGENGPPHSFRALALAEELSGFEESLFIEYQIL